MKTNLLYKTIIFLVILVKSQVGWSQDITIEIGKSDVEYETDFAKSFKIQFKAKKGAKADINISQTDPPMSEVLSKNADLSTKTIDFNYDPSKKKPFVKNSKEGDVPIDGNFQIIVDGKEYQIVKSHPAPPKVDTETQNELPYWSYVITDKIAAFSLKQFYIDPSFLKCCDDCKSCDDTSFGPNNRIIYDARSGVTYFVPQDSSTTIKLCDPQFMKRYRVGNRKKIVLDAGDPVVLIVENVNPGLYNVEIADSSFLTNNESTSALERLLFQSSEGTSSNIPEAQSTKGKGSAKEDYVMVKAALLLVRAEMVGLLENLRVGNLYLHNCIQERKQAALKEIDAYPMLLMPDSSKLGKYRKLSFLQLTDIFLDRETEDSVLNKQIHKLYSEFLQTASYKIAYRYSQIPEHDILNFRVAIKPKPSTPYPSLLNTQMRHPTQTVYVRRFFKVDVSSGLYMGFKKDRTYSLAALQIEKEGQPVDMKRIVREDRNRELGFASYLHMYYKFHSVVNPAFTIGAGVSFDRTVRPRYFTGLSLLVGQNNRICISGGAIWGNYEDLSNQYTKTGKEFDFLSASTTELAYRTTFKGGWFVSLSYNLPFLKRKSSTEAKPSSSNESNNDKSADKGSTTSADSKNEEQKDKK